MLDPGQSVWLDDVTVCSSSAANCSNFTLAPQLPPSQGGDSEEEIDIQTGMTEMPSFYEEPSFQSFDDPVMEAIHSAVHLSCHSSSETVLFNTLMEEVSHLPTKTVNHIPRSVRPLLGKVLSVEFKHAIKNGIWGFARLHMFAKAVLRCPPRGGRKKRYVVKSILQSRLDRWQSGDLPSLWADARADAISHMSSSSKKPSIAQNNARRSLALAREGRFRDAMRVLGSYGLAASDDNDAIHELQQRHPCHSLPEWNTDIPPTITVNQDSVLTALRAFPRGSSPGASQLQHQHLIDAIDGTTTPSSIDCLDSLTQFICFLLSGHADVRISPWLVGAPLTALRKKSGGIRPIAVGEILRRLASRLCCMAVKSTLPEVFLPYGQVGVGVPGGVEAAIHALSALLDEHGDNADLCCLKIDFSNAFNECFRSSFLHRLHREFPALFGWAQWCYHCEGFLNFGDILIPSSGGVQQGDPLGPLLFSLVIMELMDSIGPLPDINMKLWYLDDGSFVGPRTAVATLLNVLEIKGPLFGLHLNTSKCEVFWPSGNQQFLDFPPEVQRITEVAGGAELLGAPLCGSDAFFAMSVAKRIDKISDCQNRLSDLDDLQVELHLLRSCLGLCKLNHIIRTVPTNKITKELLRFDVNLRHCLESLSRSSISNEVWSQATRPIRLGGLGLREASRSAPAAFLGSCNSSRDLTSRLLLSCSLPFHQSNETSHVEREDQVSEITIPGELDCRSILSTLLPDNQDLQIRKMTQKEIQRLLDVSLSLHIQDSTPSIRDKARLNAISTPHSGSWLRALPNTNLGLVMSREEFLVALRLRLGIAVFPSSPLLVRCPCGQVIDKFGDHVLGCGSGPLRLKRHNALCDILYRYLLVDNAGSRREQCFSSESNDRPGDVFHPDFLQGKAAFFDISVRNSFTNHFINSCSTKAGAAAEAGEVQKDLRYDSDVTSAGASFYPMIVETYGTWSTYSLEIIKVIARKTSVLNKLPVSRIVCNIHEQLAVRLWQYNARMVLDRLHLVCHGE